VGPSDLLGHEPLALHFFALSCRADDTLLRKEGLEYADHGGVARNAYARSNQAGVAWLIRC